MFPFEAILFLFLLIVAVMVARLRNLFAAAMLTGLSSLLTVGLFLLMDAVDVAFTEAAVGSGLTTVLLLGSLALTETRESQRHELRLGPLLVVILTGAALVYGSLDMPHYGDPKAPVHSEISARFIEGSRASDPSKAPTDGLERYRGEVAVPNVVTSVLASYRSFDTFGETTVVLAAGLGVILVLGGRRRKVLQ